MPTKRQEAKEKLPDEQDPKGDLRQASKMVKAGPFLRAVDNVRSDRRLTDTLMSALMSQYPTIFLKLYHYAKGPGKFVNDYLELVREEGAEESCRMLRKKLSMSPKEAFRFHRLCLQDRDEAIKFLDREYECLEEDEQLTENLEKSGK